MVLSVYLPPPLGTPTKKCPYIGSHSPLSCGWFHGLLVLGKHEGMIPKKKNLRYPLRGSWVHSNSFPTYRTRSIWVPTKKTRNHRLCRSQDADSPAIALPMASIAPPHSVSSTTWVIAPNLWVLVSLRRFTFLQMFQEDSLTTSGNWV